MGCEGRAGGSNSALRGLLDEAGMSNAALARAVVTAGAEEGVHVGTNTTSVKRMLDGSQPRWPVPRLVAKVLSRHLHREFNVTECGFADRAPASDDRYDGLRCSGTLDGTIRTVVELSGRDMRRRRFLLGSAFTAGAFSEPALFALTVPPAESTARAGSRRIGMADVEIQRMPAHVPSHVAGKPGAVRDGGQQRLASLLRVAAVQELAGLVVQQLHQLRADPSPPRSGIPAPAGG